MTGSTVFIVEIKALQKLISEKNALLLRAADALEQLGRLPDNCTGDFIDFIAELRKAAQ